MKEEPKTTDVMAFMYNATMKHAQDRVSDALRNLDDALRDCACTKRTYLALFVAALCEVDVRDIMSLNTKASVTNARYLFYYALRYLLGYNYVEISDKTEFDGGKMTPDGIRKGVEVMAGYLRGTHGGWRKKYAMLVEIFKTETES